MWQSFRLVLVDLWRFAFGLDGSDQNANSHLTTPLTLKTPAQPASLPTKRSQLFLNQEPTTLLIPTIKKTNDLLPEVATAAGTVYVVSSPAGARLLARPELLFDIELRQLPFGQSLNVRQFVGRYAEVLAGDMTGFVLKDDITPHLDEVWPVYQNGQVYGPDQAVTKIIRIHQQDEFLAGALALPLTAIEYITMRLKRDRLVIPWPAEVRPRPTGQWHTILKGRPGVRIGIKAEADTIMEWEGEDGEGKVAYVEAVLPDETLRISTVGVVMAGEYTESILPLAVWREWRPVFISVH